MQKNTLHLFDKKIYKNISSEQNEEYKDFFNFILKPNKKYFKDEIDMVKFSDTIYELLPYTNINDTDNIEKIAIFNTLLYHNIYTKNYLSEIFKILINKKYVYIQSLI